MPTYQFPKVVDGVSEKSGYAQVMRPIHLVRRRQFRVHVHTGQIQQRVPVVRSVLRLDFMVISRDSVKGGVDEGLDGILLS